MIPESEIQAYVALAPCGCVKLLAADVPEHAKTTAKEVAACIRTGCTVERTSVPQAREIARTRMMSCKQCDPKRARKAKQASVQQEALDL